MNILLADCGSTKCDWALVDTENHYVIKQFKTVGLNVALYTERELLEFVGEEVAPNVDREHIDTIKFYGAGAGINPRQDKMLRNTLSIKFPDAEIEIDTDLVGAAVALFGSSPGVACILGTGSNSGVYDGAKIIANTPPLGFILGDEGSGASLGKRLVNAIFKGLLSTEITEKFEGAYHLTKQQLIERVYRQSFANVYLASFAPFLSANISNPEIKELVLEEFRSFIKHNLLQYNELNNQIKIGFVGSIAISFRPQIETVIREFFPSLPTINFLPSPIEGLVKH